LPLAQESRDELQNVIKWRLEKHGKNLNKTEKLSNFKTITEEI